MRALLLEVRVQDCYLRTAVLQCRPNRIMGSAMRTVACKLLLESVARGASLEVCARFLVVMTTKKQLCFCRPFKVHENSCRLPRTPRRLVPPLLAGRHLGCSNV